MECFLIILGAVNLLGLIVITRKLDKQSRINGRTDDLANEVTGTSVLGYDISDWRQQISLKTQLYKSNRNIDQLIQIVLPLILEGLKSKGLEEVLEAKYKTSVDNLSVYRGDGQIYVQLSSSESIEFTEIIKQVNEFNDLKSKICCKKTTKRAKQ